MCHPTGCTSSRKVTSPKSPITSSNSASNRRPSIQTHAPQGDNSHSNRSSLKDVLQCLEVGGISWFLLTSLTVISLPGLFGELPRQYITLHKWVGEEFNMPCDSECFLWKASSLRVTPWSIQKVLCCLGKWLLNGPGVAEILPKVSIIENKAKSTWFDIAAISS